MKHTYLYPIRESEIPIWQMGRIGASDIIATLEEEPPSPAWRAYIRISDALAEGEGVLRELLYRRDRVCIGNHYMIPGSLCEVAQSQGHDAHPSVRKVTEMLWDAPIAHGANLANVVHILREAGEDAPGRDSVKDIENFCAKYTYRPGGERWHIIPVWM